MKNFTTPFRMFGAALTMSAAVLSFTAFEVSADSRNPGLQCAASVGSGVYQYNAPGAYVTDTTGLGWLCGYDTQWVHDDTLAKGKGKGTGKITQQEIVVVKMTDGATTSMF
jgi:hypothetical protein